MDVFSKNTGMNEQINFGPTVKRLRLEAGMTQEDLCAATDYVLQPGYLSQLERQPRAISFNILHAISHAVSIPIADIIREAEGGEEAEFTGSHIPIRDSDGHRTGKMLPVSASIPVNSFALEINNNSMETGDGISYFKGGYAIIKPCEKLEAGNDYAFRVDDHLFLARYESDGRRHLLTYLNPKYPHETLQSEPDIKGLVIGFFYESR